jgi:lipopolysaccharide transport system ATP-binding protein
MSSDIAISLSKLSKCYEIYDRPQDRLKQLLLMGQRKYFREFWALREVSLQIKRGSTVGIIGRNGSGKSTLLQMICGTLTPTAGSIDVSGRIAALLELGAGFNHEFTGRENVYFNAGILGLTRREVEERFDLIAEFADIGDALEQPIKTYSSGMVVRLAFAVAVHTDPEILIVDEALAVGDMIFQARCLDHIGKMKERGVTTLFVTHDIGTFQTLCDYGYLLNDGRLYSEGAPEHLAAQYYHLAQEQEYQRQRKTSAQSAKSVAETKLTDAGGTGKASGLEEYRFGSSEASIVDFRLLNAKGEQTQSLEVGKQFAVEIDIAIHARLSDLTAAVVFRNAQGQNLFGANTRYDGHVKISPLEPGARFTIRMEMHMLLNPGEYLLHLGVSEHRSDHLYVSLDNRDKVDVVSVYGKPVSFGLIHHTPDFKVTQHTLGQVYGAEESLKHDN